METADTPLILDLLAGLALGAPFALLAFRLVRISAAGIVAGLLCAAVIYAAFYLAGFAVLGIALVLTVGSTRISGARKHADLLPEDDRRGAANILANCLVGTLGATAELLAVGVGTEITALWCVTGIAAGASDTVASEIGKAFGGHPRAFPSFRKVRPGTPGAVSGAGTVSAMLAAALIASPAAVLWLLPWQFLTAVVLGSTVGAFAESALATAFEGDGGLGNHQLNLLCTAISCFSAVAFAFYGCA